MKPVYMINGFLESGKTEFITYTIAQSYFRTKGKTLIIACEDGEIEYDPILLKKTNAVVEWIEEEEDFNTSNLLELEKKYNYFVATIIVSVIWWLWHLPLFYIPGVAQDGMNFGLFGIKVLGLSFALASIKKNTNSVWLCVLFHCLVNSLAGIYVVNDNVMGAVVTTIVLIVVSFIFNKVNNNKKIFN